MKLENQNIKEKIENSVYYKYQGIAPEGFKLIPDEVLEDLKDFDNWKDFKADSIGWIKKRSIAVLKKIKQVPTFSINNSDHFGDVYDDTDY